MRPSARVMMRVAVLCIVLLLACGRQGTSVAGAPSAAPTTAAAGATAAATAAASAAAAAVPAAAVAVAPIPSVATAPYHTLLSTAELLHASASLRISSPAALVGTLRWMPSPWAGPCFVLNSTAARAAAAAAPTDAAGNGNGAAGSSSNYTLSARIILRHSADSCSSSSSSGVTHAANDEGQPYAGSIVLLPTDQRCNRHSVIQQFALAGALAVAIVRLEDKLTPLGDWLVQTATPMAIGKQDGDTLLHYLGCRRAWLAAGSNTTTGTAWRSADGACDSALQDYAAELRGSVTGTGPTAAGDVAALREIMSHMSVNPDSITPDKEGVYGSWSALQNFGSLALPGADPCLQRVAGLYCEAGRVVSVNLDNLGLNGTLHPAWGQLTALRYLNLGIATQYGGLSGAIPDEMGQMTQLEALLLDDNKLTTLPSSIGGLSKLQALSLRYNRITQLPASLGQLSASLLVLDVSSNALTSTPDSVFQLSNLRDLNLQDNPLSLNCTRLSFRSMRSLQQLILTNTSATGHFAPDAFDGLTELGSVDLAYNAIEGLVPSFAGCTALRTFSMAENRLSSTLPTFASRPPALTSIALNGNALYGVLPVEWQDLPSLRTLYLQHNQLRMGNLRTLRAMTALQYVDLSYNFIFLDELYVNDFGYFAWEAVPLKLHTLLLAHNQIEGQFAAGWLDKPALRTLSVAQNGLTSLPADLFTTSITSLDFSSNRLTGPFPSSPPRFNADLHEFQPVTLLDLHDNPSFVNHSSSVSSLSWVQASDEYTQVHNIICPKLKAASSALTLIADAGLIGWGRCCCAPATFGAAPYCKPIPSGLKLGPFSAPTAEAALDVDALLAATPSFSVDGNTMQLAHAALQARGNSNSSSSSISSNGTLVLSFNSSTTVYPPSFSDSWYSKPIPASVEALTLVASFQVDVSTLRYDHVRRVQLLDDAYNSALARTVSAGDADAATTTPQPVRILTLLLHVSRAHFREQDLLEVYTSQPGLVRRITRADVLNGTQSALNLSSVVSDEAAYRRVYARALALVQDPVLFVVPVAGGWGGAYVDLTSTDSPHARFVATYSYAFDCATAAPGGAARVVEAVREGYQCLTESADVYLPFNSAVECRAQLDPLNGNATLQLSRPEESKYASCRCRLGLFGSPPFCGSIPLSSTVSPFAMPLSSSPVLANYSLMRQDTAAPAAMTVPNAAVASTYPAPLSDAWFGERRFSAGFTSSWSIDLQDLRLDTLAASFPSSGGGGSSNRSVLSRYPAVSASTLSGLERFQPVRVITVRLHVERAVFRQSAANSLAVYAGSTSGERVLLLEGNDAGLAACKRSTPATLVRAYQQAYAASLSTLRDPCVLEVSVLSNHASLSFSSRDSGGTHWLATYAFDFACPAGMQLDPAEHRCLALYEVNGSARAGVYVCSALTSVWILVQMANMAAKWDAPIYRAASRHFLALQTVLLLVLSNGALLYASVPSPGTVSGSFICTGRAWFTALPLTVLFAVLLAKTFRVQQLFNNASILKPLDVSDRAILRTVLLLSLPQLAMLLLYSLYGLSEPTLRHGQGVLADQLVASCSDDAAGGGRFWPFMIVEMVFLLALLLLACVLAFRTRNVPSAFNEHTQIYQCLLSMLASAAFLLTLLIWLQDDPNACILLQGCGQALIAFVMCTWLLLPKMFISLTHSVQSQRDMAETLPVAQTMFSQAHRSTLRTGSGHVGSGHNNGKSSLGHSASPPDAVHANWLTNASKAKANAASDGAVAAAGRNENGSGSGSGGGGSASLTRASNSSGARKPGAGPAVAFPVFRKPHAHSLSTSSAAVAPAQTQSQSPSQPASPSPRAAAPLSPLLFTLPSPAVGELGAVEAATPTTPTQAECETLPATFHPPASPSASSAPPTTLAPLSPRSSAAHAAAMVPGLESADTFVLRLRTRLQRTSGGGGFSVTRSPRAASPAAATAAAAAASPVTAAALSDVRLHLLESAARPEPLQPQPQSDANASVSLASPSLSSPAEPTAAAAAAHELP